MSVIVLFIDGLGLGKLSMNNPVASGTFESLYRLGNGQTWTGESEFRVSKGLYYCPVDATLGVEGLPQSGTGQTALFTGINAARIAGRHYGPFPHTKTKDHLRKRSLFHAVLNLDKVPHFVNAYPDIFFSTMKKRPRWTCTTLMAKAAGQQLNQLDKVKAGEALTAGINQLAWKERLRLDVPELSPAQAGKRLTAISENFDLTLFEYYQTDKAGHSRDSDLSRHVITLLDTFIGSILLEKRESDYLVICSDHGNIEDLSTKSHTRNRVPLVIAGPNADLLPEASSIMDVMPLILGLLENEQSI